ncbi:2-oxoglutarate dehydrogenase E1 component [Portibacter lacus]|uniref:oxoglutarate dehydrogenase (succinyl-transferring) n=1 Tax=Portibacter lacus TaxID=1099794 RepID=A0AA37SLY2_9BACT|nr:2-oxoglutarate dehydrogenase E1 component [Portibacter lacus]GLR17003.1 2-oxoglutarate dehydrogenase subunit E1 [Portibacter lacus]
MSDYSYVFNAHPTYIEDMYSKYQSDPATVDQAWRTFFEGFDFGASANGNGAIETALGSSNTTKEFGVLSIIHGFRSRGHLLSTTNPIRSRRDRRPHLDLSDYNLEESDLNKVFEAGGEIGMKNATLQEIIDQLRKVYTSDLGIEYAHIENKEKRMWLRDKIEGRNLENDYGLSLDKKKRILEKLNGASIFEKFLHTKYVGQKRFSLEGGETTIAALDAIINTGAADKVQEVIIGMAHRGRLNVLANIMNKTYETIFSEFEGTAVPDLSFGDGDVKYHLGYSSMVETPSGKTVHLKLTPNPSHLEAVNTVVEGFARAKADILYGSDYDQILPILIHGDAAVAGQGIAFETVQMSQLAGYYTGGTIHFVINNQIGFTTDFDDARSSTYSTAVASIVQAPVFHVNGDNPDAVVYASELATEYRQLFNNDVFIDMVCYRKHGHNEGDDPKFTQPQMYEFINDHKNPREVYVDKLTAHNAVDKDMAEKLEAEFWATLQDRLDLIKEKDLPYKYQEPEQAWRSLKKKTDASDYKISPKTGITKKNIDKILNHLMTVPDDFNLLSKINRLQKGKKKLLDQNNLDWALAELLAYGSILLEGKNVRMSGQDVKRGTFSHRHAIFNDAKTFKDYNRLSNISEDQGRFMIYNSLLSEFGVLGFEYGYSLATPEALVLWEAQFGDFANGAQTIFDQFISAGESKWQRMSGIVMLLPHGYEGQGPEHSSARLERYLSACAENNLTVANITTPANFFHSLRRQLERPFRKPLIIMSPKSLLRHPLCVSDKDEFSTNNRFEEVLVDHETVAKTKRVLLCSGKIYYDLLEKKLADKRNDVVLVRLEQLYPFPTDKVNELFDKYKKAEFLWVQEEPKNMGAWYFILNELRDTNIQLVSRKASASPATGFKKVHDKEQADILAKALG